MKIILHIGLHKTGTTFLQSCCDAHRDELKSVGVLFPQSGFMAEHIGSARKEASPGHQGVVKAVLHNDAAGIKNKLKSEIDASGCHTVLISGENFSLPLSSPEIRKKHVQRVAEFFSEFGDVEIVAVIREPHSYLEALYREHVTSLQVREAKTATQFSELHFRNTLNFSQLFEPWAERFGDKLTLLSYADLTNEGNYFAAFLGALNIQISQHPVPVSVYRTPNREVIETLRVANSFGTPLDEHMQAMQGVIEADQVRTDRKNRPQSAIEPAMRLQILNFCEKQSRAFLENHGCHLNWQAQRDLIAREIEEKLFCPVSRTFGPTLENYMFHLNVTRASKNQGSLLRRIAKNTIGPLLSNPISRRLLEATYRRLPERLQRVARRAL